MGFDYDISRNYLCLEKMWIFELMDLGVGGFENHGIYGMDYKEIVENFPVQADGLCPLCLWKMWNLFYDLNLWIL